MIELATNAADLVIARLKVEEGFRTVAYRDTVGRLTFGYGCNIDAGISEYAATALLEAQVQEREQALAAYAWYPAADAKRASVFLDLSFNLGLHGLLAFPSMLHFAALKDWPNASAQLLDSDAARQLPARYKTLAGILLNG